MHRSPRDSPAPRPPSPQWAPERAVSAAEAAELIAEQFAQLRGAPVEPLATGWDNSVFLVDRTWAFRFPRREIALPGVEREIAVLPALAPRLPLPIPVPELVGRPSPRYPWPFWGGRLLPGAEFAEADLDPAGLARVATGIGAFLRVLHDPRLVTEVRADLPRDPMRRGDPALRALRTREPLARLVEQGLREPDGELDRFLTAAARLAAPTGADAISHGDLHIRHVLVATGGITTGRITTGRITTGGIAADGPGQGAVAGVIDWGDLCVADPALDLSLAYSGFAGPARAAFLAAYGPVGAARETAARVLAIFLSVTLAAYAADTGRTRLLAESLAGIDRALA